jgi:hypothetical protein
VITFRVRTHTGLLMAIAAATIAPAGLNAQAGRQPARATISQVSWLAGDWVGRANSVTFEERWTPPAGGAMLGVSRTIKEDRMVTFEFLRIVERAGGLVYIAQPNGRPPTEFALTALAADSATFENPTHDFPKMIRYVKHADDTLEAQVSDGGHGETFVFRLTP